MSARWELESAVDVGGGQGQHLQKLLADGWEPFAAYDARVYFRRKVET